MVLQAACIFFQEGLDIIRVMEKLFVNKTIEVNASASKVWNALTRREFTDQWAREFTGGAEFHIESDWTLGSPVLWTDQDGNVIVQGNVTALELEKFLRFSVFDVHVEKPPVTEEDGITYELTEQEGKTLLMISQGDFSTMSEGEKYRDMSAEIWDRVLAKVKELAEE